MTLTKFSAISRKLPFGVYTPCARINGSHIRSNDILVRILPLVTESARVFSAQESIGEQHRALERPAAIVARAHRMGDKEGHRAHRLGTCVRRSGHLTKTTSKSPADAVTARVVSRIHLSSVRGSGSLFLFLPLSIAKLRCVSLYKAAEVGRVLSMSISVISEKRTYSI